VKKKIQKKQIQTLTQRQLYPKKIQTTATNFADAIGRGADFLHLSLIHATKEQNLGCIGNVAKLNSFFFTHNNID
jgi:hypothetical protein